MQTDLPTALAAAAEFERIQGDATPGPWFYEQQTSGYWLRRECEPGVCPSLIAEVGLIFNAELMATKPAAPRSPRSSVS